MNDRVNIDSGFFCKAKGRFHQLWLNTWLTNHDHFLTEALIMIMLGMCSTTKILDLIS